LRFRKGIWVGLSFDPLEPTPFAERTHVPLFRHFGLFTPFRGLTFRYLRQKPCKSSFIGQITECRATFTPNRGSIRQITECRATSTPNLRTRMGKPEECVPQPLAFPFRHRHRVAENRLTYSFAHHGDYATQRMQPQKLLELDVALCQLTPQPVPLATRTHVPLFRRFGLFSPFRGLICR
jgi:hypothetical protein